MPGDMLNSLGTLLLRWIAVATGYMSGSGTFPRPLSAEEEKTCLGRMAQGDSEARNVLVEHNLRLVAHIVKKFDASGEDAEDLISIGTVGLIKGINTFCSEKGTRLATYAARCIENEILMHFRAVRKRRGDVYLQDPVGVDREGNELTFLDILTTEEDTVLQHVEQKSEKKRLQKHLRMLNGKDRHVIIKRYGIDGYRRHTQREVAKQLGISRSYVSRIEKRALERTRKLLDEGE